MDDNVIEFNEFTAPTSCTNSEVCCWLCQRGTSLRALFCQHCGSIQPVRALDHFSRLGLERRIDIDSALLERRYNSLKKALDPARFAIRGLGERGHAAKQYKALEEAYDTLREPLRRGRYWLALHEREVKEAEGSNPMVAELRAELEGASLPPQCDRIAHKAGTAMEQGIVSLMQALRSQNWQLANAILMEVDGLENLMDDVRGRRTSLALTAAPSSDEDVTRIK
ncbi:MAG: molecular chaperone DnaJ [Alphaproteobacteria bacterium]|nr:molecular chaperone DnaJ [Alphaproteobacteria bacterium]